ncbi:hypothetical protein [Streptomyces sp. NBC_00199]|uniref:hypothetical protein n=1 Tax=Streptomyces sp. NBC_00199 TaxID=2975678 RepID=UPI002258FD67|nr:hypothetical protein [Streptomyces sp. NBC_00199]MCX5265840.1 hypothetical protein [Streptomyces sp. NBC_00199]
MRKRVDQRSGFVTAVYAAGAVPGQFVPGARAAFLTTAAFTLLASTLAALILRSHRPAHAKTN